MTSRALIATLFMSFLSTALAALPTSQAFAAPPCYTVVAGVLTSGASCSGAVVIDDSVTSIGVSAFENNTGVTSVVIPSTVTSIGDSAFRTADGVARGPLASVTLNAGLVTIGERAFENSSLTSVFIPSTVTSIDTHAFRTYDGLAPGPLASVTLNVGLVTIGDRAFENSSLTSVIIPSTVTSIGVLAFGTRDGLARGPLAIVELSAGLVTIGAGAFENSSLTSVSIPSTVTSIGNSAFRTHDGLAPGPLASVALNNGLVTIGDRAFENSSLTSVIIPSTVTSIGVLAFGTGHGLARGPLTTLGIGTSVSTLGMRAFWNANLTCVRASGEAPAVGVDAFGPTPPSSLFYISGTAGWTPTWQGIPTTAQTLLPASGSQSGGTSVTLTSCGLTGIASVLFGGRPASFSVSSSSVLTATAPAGSPGTVDVELQNAMGVRQKVGTFTYIADPVPPSPSPAVPVDAPVVVTPVQAPVQVPVPVAEPPRPSLGNPSQPAVVAPGVVLVSETQAEETAQRVMRNEPAQNIGGAPTVNSSAGSPVALTSPGLTPGLTYQVRIKVEGEYRDLGNTQAAADGEAVLPVFRLSRVGNYTIALISPLDGSARYIKVRVGKRR